MSFAIKLHKFIFLSARVFCRFYFTEKTLFIIFFCDFLKLLLRILEKMEKNCPGKSPLPQSLLKDFLLKRNLHLECNTLSKHRTWPISSRLLFVPPTRILSRLKKCEKS